MAEPVWVPTRRYVDVALGLLGADESAELILRTVSVVILLIGINYKDWTVIDRSTNTAIDTNTTINSNTDTH